MLKNGVHKVRAFCWLAFVMLVVALVEHGSVAAFNAFGLQLMVNGTALKRGCH
jgi:hypothetical protein